MKKVLVFSIILAGFLWAQPAEPPQTEVKTSTFPMEIGYIVELPPDYDTVKTYPLIVAIHGYGDHMSAYNGTAQMFYPDGAIGLYPESPYPFFMEENERWGWTWWQWSDTTDPAFVSYEVTLDQSVRWIVQAIEEVKRDYPVDEEKVFLFGFSQGGFLTFKVGLEYPQLFRGLLPAGGWMEFDTLTPFNLDSAAVDLPVRILHGEYDPVVEFAGAVAAFDTLTAYAVPVELMRYPAEHTLPRELWEDARDFVYCQLYEEEVPPLTALLWPGEELTAEKHAELLKKVLCSPEPVSDIEAGLLLLAEENTDTLVELQVIYLLGARRCLGSEEYLTNTMQDVAKPQLLRQAALNALNKLGSETAWQTTAAVKKQVVITEVVEGTQADSLGLAAGDVLVSYDGKAAKTYLDFRKALAEVKPKKNKIKMVIMRDGERMTIPLAPGFIGIRLAEEIK